jgi:hypothetical protein
MFDLHPTSPRSFTSTVISTGPLQMESVADRSWERQDAQSRVHAAPLVEYSHEQSASVLYHQQFKHWEDDPWHGPVPTPGTRYSLNFTSRPSSRIVRGKSTGRKYQPRLSKRHSPPSRGDSGYGSSRAPTLSDSSKEDVDFHPGSLNEFGGLHRSPCCHLHEPQLYESERPKPQEGPQGTTTCDWCLNTGLHNLSWSASHIQLEVFRTALQQTRSEIEREGTSDEGGQSYLISLDAANNSSLHYAAAGGARFEHFNLLVELGIRPCQLNTAGQLFLHCWRPHIEDSKDSLDQNL